MPRGIYKRRSPVQEKLARMKDIVLKDALSGEKNAKELANVYGVHPSSLLKFHKENGVKKKRKYVSGYCKGKIEDLRSYIKENDITKEDIFKAILSI